MQHATPTPAYINSAVGQGGAAKSALAPAGYDVGAGADDFAQMLEGLFPTGSHSSQPASAQPGSALPNNLPPRSTPITDAQTAIKRALVGGNRQSASDNQKAEGKPEVSQSFGPQVNKTESPDKSRAKTPTISFVPEIQVAAVSVPILTSDFISAPGTISIANAGSSQTNVNQALPTLSAQNESGTISEMRVGLASEAATNPAAKPLALKSVNTTGQALSHSPKSSNLPVSNDFIPELTLAKPSITAFPNSEMALGSATAGLKTAKAVAVTAQTTPSASGKINTAQPASSSAAGAEALSPPSVIQRSDPITPLEEAAGIVKGATIISSSASQVAEKAPAPPALPATSINEQAALNEPVASAIGLKDVQGKPPAAPFTSPLTTEGAANLGKAGSQTKSAVVPNEPRSLSGQMAETASTSGSAITQKPGLSSAAAPAADIPSPSTSSVQSDGMKIAARPVSPTPNIPVSPVSSDAIMQPISAPVVAGAGQNTPALQPSNSMPAESVGITASKGAVAVVQLPVAIQGNVISSENRPSLSAFSGAISDAYAIPNRPELTSAAGLIPLPTIAPKLNRSSEPTVGLLKANFSLKPALGNVPNPGPAVNDYIHSLLAQGSPEIAGNVRDTAAAPAPATPAGAAGVDRSALTWIPTAHDSNPPKPDGAPALRSASGGNRFANQMVTAPVAPTGLASSGVTGANGNPAPSVQGQAVIHQIADLIDRAHSAASSQQVVLQLKPEHLGSVRLELRSTGDGVTARVITESPEVKQTLEQGRADLQNMMQQRGVNLSSLDVSVGFAQSGMRSFERNFRESAGGSGVRPLSVSHSTEPAVPIERSRIAPSGYSRLDTLA